MELSFRQKRRLKKVSVLIFILILCAVFHRQILGGIGNFLIFEDDKQHTEALVVLGGNSYERGLEALNLYQEGWSDHIICTGGNIPTVLAAIDTSIYESQITKSMLVKKGINEDHIVALTESTSTKEEANEIFNYCSANKLKKITIISSKFHMRRVRMVFKEAFENTDVEVTYRGAPSQSYDEDQWWKSEAGLIMVNNEYVKYAYYLIKY